MGRLVITIARGYGSGGRTMGRLLAEELGIKFYDRELVRLASDKSGISESMFGEVDERVKTNPFFPRVKRTYHGTGAGPDSANFASEENLFHLQAEVIKELAETEDCIIVGRCADYILRDFPNVVNIYIYAPEDDRIETCIERYNIPDREAKRRIEDVDDARRAYHLRYAGYEPDDHRYKDIMINSSFLGFEGTAHYLCECIKEKFHISE